MMRITPSLVLRGGFRLLTVLAVSLFAGLALTASAADKPEKADKKDSESKWYSGTLKTGVMAIGAETTGYTLTTTDGAVYELEFGMDVALKKKADGLHQKKVTIVGEYRPRPGVEIKERRIIVVKSLRAGD